jgi:xanthine dehydrogenase YagR molybdenum-binding subunit
MSQATIGQPIRRVDGHLKVTGQATYAAEFDIPNVAHAVMVTSTIARGRIRSVDITRAEKVPGVLRVITHRNAPKLPYNPRKGFLDPPIGERLHVLQDDRVWFNGQPLAVVVAESLDQAEYAASLVRFEYTAETPEIDFDGSIEQAAAPREAPEPGLSPPADTRRGDPERAFSEAGIKIDAVYRIPREQHNPMEPHATIARWDGDGLTLWDKTQWVTNVQVELAAIFGLAPEKVRVISPFVGGAFGTTLRPWGHVTIAALAARQVGRPVKLVVTRRQMYAGTGCRPETWQRLRVGAAADGRLTALMHEGTAETSKYEEYTEQLVGVSTFLHSCPNVATHYRLAPLDIHTPIFMRAPGAASGIFALESALDELAYRIGVDPVELRLRNEPEKDEGSGLPFSSRSTRECYRLGAERFGWARRNPEPRSMRDGRWLIGLGVATAVYHTIRGAAGARARLLRTGRAEIESGASDMGPGTYTSMTQVASDALGLPMDRIRFVLGDSIFPPAAPHGGSMTMASVGPAVQAACFALRAKALALAVADSQSPLHSSSPEDIEASGGRLHLRADPSRGETYVQIMARSGVEALEAAETAAPGEEHSRYSMSAYGAIFAEVAVDSDLGLVRVRKLTGAYGVGRIINPRTARSQMIGGMVGGMGMALLEQTVIDRQTGRVANATMADYLVPVNADVPDLEVIFVDEDDPHVNSLGAKGVGELALVGVAPAIANAVFHATGKRIRDLPITLEKLL